MPSEDYVELNTFVGDWTDSLGNNVVVYWARPGSRGGPLNVELSKPRGGRGPIRLDVKDLGRGHFQCGHYDLDVDASSSKRIVWLDQRNRGKKVIWESEAYKRRDRSRDRSRSRGRDRVETAEDADRLVFDGRRGRDGSPMAGRGACEDQQRSSDKSADSRGAWPGGHGGQYYPPGGYPHGYYGAGYGSWPGAPPAGYQGGWPGAPPPPPGAWSAASAAGPTPGAWVPPAAPGRTAGDEGHGRAPDLDELLAQCDRPTAASSQPPRPSPAMPGPPASAPPSMAPPAGPPPAMSPPAGPPPGSPPGVPPPAPALPDAEPQRRALPQAPPRGPRPAAAAEAPGEAISKFLADTRDEPGAPAPAEDAPRDPRQRPPPPPQAADAPRDPRRRPPDAPLGAPGEPPPAPAAEPGAPWLPPPPPQGAGGPIGWGAPAPGWHPPPQAAAPAPGPAAGEGPAVAAAPRAWDLPPSGHGWSRPAVAAPPLPPPPAGAPPAPCGATPAPAAAVPWGAASAPPLPQDAAAAQRLAAYNAVLLGEEKSHSAPVGAAASATEGDDDQEAPWKKAVQKRQQEE